MTPNDPPVSREVNASIEMQIAITRTFKKFGRQTISDCRRRVLAESATGTTQGFADEFNFLIEADDLHPRGSKGGEVIYEYA